MTPATQLLAEARELFSVFGKNKKAIALVDRVLTDDANNVDALNLKASILYDMDQDDDAWEYHQRVIAIEPHSVEALYGLASIANERGDYQDALKWAQRALRAIPDDPYPEFADNEDYRQRLIGEVYNEYAFALWYLDNRTDAKELLENEASEACPLEIESFEEQLAWLEDHPDSPEE